MSAPVYSLVPRGTSDVYAAGYEGNRFASEAEAEAAIPGLRACGAEYDHEWDVILQTPDAAIEECEDNACAGCAWCDAAPADDCREWDDGTMGGRDQFEER